MQLSTRILALSTAFALICAAVASSASAASLTSTFLLHPTKMAVMAHGSVQVTQVSTGDYKVAVTIQNMPGPSTLHTTPLRHAYVAWAFDPSKLGRPSTGPAKGSRPANPAAMLGKLTPIALHATSNATYTGTATLMLAHSPGIIVTAEVSAMTHAAAMPFWGVLIGTPMMPK